MSDAVSFDLSVNGELRSVSAEPRKTLADVLREDLGLTGTHLGCEQGGCGACTVLLDGEVVRSCLMFAVQAQEAEITTIEGIGSTEELHPMQAAFSEYHGLQCGFCTPGFVIASKTLLDQNPNPTREEIQAELSGNICRCGTYPFIFEAVASAAKKMK